MRGRQRANGRKVLIRIVTSVTLASGGLAAAASLAMGVAAADPDATTIDPGVYFPESRPHDDAVRLLVLTRELF
jgi:hypothetical protein